MRRRTTRRPLIGLLLLTTLIGCGSGDPGAAPAGSTTQIGATSSVVVARTSVTQTPVTQTSVTRTPVARTPGPRPPVTRTPVTRTSITRATVTPTSAGSAADPNERFPLCPTVPVTDFRRLSDCVHADLVEYWERVTDQPINRPVVIEPTFPPEPRSCFAPQTIYAYYCPGNQTIYLNTSILRLWRQRFSPADAAYSLAVTLAHEVGHAAQFALDPALNNADTSDPATSRKIELQADCLAGVWAHSEVAAGRLDANRWLTVWRREAELLNTSEHQQTHGDPASRITAIHNGMATGKPTSCGLRTP